MIKTYQYRIYPTTKQQVSLEAILEACQTLYNQALEMRIKAHKAGASITYTTQQTMLTALRNQSDFWNALHIDILQDTLRRLDNAYKAFFRRVTAGEKPGFPRFKGKGRYRSITFSHLSKQLIRTVGRKFARLVVPKLGHVNLRYHRPLPDGNIKTLTLQRKASGWYANIAIEVADVPKVEIQTAIGIDVGLESFLTTSDGDKVDNPRHLRVAEKQLKKKQRHLSRRKKQSHRCRKQVAILAKHHEHIANQRRDFHYKTAHTLFSKFDAVTIETLQIRNLLKNHHLAKSIADAAWGNFCQTLESKAENAGKHLLKVPPQGTSQECSQCSHIVKKSLAVRIHHCTNCDLKIDRDHNSARVVLFRAAPALRGGAPVPNGPARPALTGGDMSHRKRERSEKPVIPKGNGHKPNPLGLGS